MLLCVTCLPAIVAVPLFLAAALLWTSVRTSPMPNMRETTPSPPTVIDEQLTHPMDQMRLEPAPPIEPAKVLPGTDNAESH